MHSRLTGFHSATMNKVIRTILLFTFLLSFSTTTFATPQPSTSANYSIKAPAEWVKDSAFQASDAAVFDGAISYQLIDWQNFFNNGELSQFSRIVMEVNNTSGLEDAAKTSISFNPDYQTLVLHQFNIIRNNKVLDRLDSARISLANTESDFDNDLITGALTALVVLRDVRVGDQIDYSYTIEGSNPVFKGGFSKSVSFDWGIDVGQIEYRFTAPVSEDVRYRTHSIHEPSQNTKNGFKQLHWQLDSLERQNYEDNTPYWYSTAPEIQLSSFKNWEQVASWGSQLFTDRSIEHESLRQYVSKLSRNSSTYKVSHALDFVQQKIRYFGVEIGENSHLPHSPVDVVELGYGDCKDKTLLFISLLEEMGISAYPALVNTRLRSKIAEQLPGPAWFNHVIALVEVGGREYWLDPTMSSERGKIEYRRAANYGAALVLGHPGKDLVNIPDRPSTIPNVETTERIYLAHKPTPTRYEIITVFHHNSANKLRSSLLSRGRNAMEKRYLKIMRQLYKHARLAEETTFDDQTEQNQIVVTEQYYIDDLINIEDNSFEFYLDKYTFRDLLTDSSQALRKSPLSLPGPARWRHHTTIVYPYTLATDRLYDSDSHSFATESMSYKSSESTIGRYKTISSELEIMNNHVAADEFSQYQEVRENIIQQIGENHSISVSENTDKTVRMIDKLMTQLESLDQTASTK